MNRQGHSSIGGKMPYEVFFGRKPRWEDRISAGPNTQIDQVPEEILDELDQVAMEAQAEYNEDEDFFPDLSGINLFDEYLARQV